MKYRRDFGGVVSRALLVLLALICLLAGCSRPPGAPTPAPTATSTATPSATPSPSASATPSTTPSATPSATPTASPTPASNASAPPPVQHVNKTFSIAAGAAVTPPAGASPSPNCVLIGTKNGTAQLLGGRASATWTPTLPTATDLQLRFEPVTNATKTIAGPSPLALSLTAAPLGILPGLDNAFGTDFTKVVVRVIIERPSGSASPTEDQVSLAMSVDAQGDDITMRAASCG